MHGPPRRRTSARRWPTCLSGTSAASAGRHRRRHWSRSRSTSQHGRPGPKAPDGVGPAGRRPTLTSRPHAPGKTTYRPPTRSLTHIHADWHSARRPQESSTLPEGRSPGKPSSVTCTATPVMLPDRGGMLLLSRACRTRPGAQSQRRMRSTAFRCGGTPCSTTRLAPCPQRLARVRPTRPQNAAPAKWT